MSAEFAACMEDVLDLYAEPYDPKRPVVCFDETSKQLVSEKRSPIPAKAGRQERFDYEYQRNGTRNLFMTCEPLAGWRHVAVTERRTMEDFAHQMRWLADAAYPEAEKVRVVLDNLNTHRPASLYEAFEPKEARRVIQRLEFHYTPKHGSWLNMAEIEFSVFSNQCLNRRIEDEETLKREIAALETERNQAAATIDWRFTTTDARDKLRRLGPLPGTLRTATPCGECSGCPGRPGPPRPPDRPRPPAIASIRRFQTDPVLGSLLRHLVTIRNCCAHHELLWDRESTTLPASRRRVQWSSRSSQCRDEWVLHGVRGHYSMKLRPASSTTRW